DLRGGGVVLRRGDAEGRTHVRIAALHGRPGLTAPDAVGTRVRRGLASMSVAWSQSPHSGQASSGWTAWPQVLWRTSTGGPSLPVIHLSPHRSREIRTGQRSRPFSVSRYSKRSG